MEPAMVREDSSCKNRPHGSAKLPRLVHGGHEGGGNPKRGIKEPVHKVNCVDPKAPRFPPYLTTLRSQFWGFTSGQILHIHLGLVFVGQGGITRNLNIEVPSNSGPEELEDDGIAINAETGGRLTRTQAAAIISTLSSLAGCSYQQYSGQRHHQSDQ
jgi:hypothetical protein